MFFYYPVAKKNNPPPRRIQMRPHRLRQSESICVVPSLPNKPEPTLSATRGNEEATLEEGAGPGAGQKGKKAGKAVGINSGEPSSRPLETK
ncbi:hypothetical protein CDAR_252241 [Caerostris darwini]|uniref:Uncharacterized protein n=1 Tax=Caerostris darwini TaxID=1538125 RepID=A0AAV4Q811_9ARAC|nr:hypothetical protein CDAR_252241 [Caerostris darwini]